MMSEDDPSGMPHLTGAVLGRYTLVRLLGAGGMGSVYEARHRDLGRRVAIKTLHAGHLSEPGARERFLREGQAAARIRHANVADVFDVVIDDELPYLVMELLEGESLAALLKRARVLPVEQAADLMVPVVAAVAAAHDQGVLHRDLKPHNIFLCSETSFRAGPRSPAHPGVWPKVLDFGISKLSEGAPGSAPDTTGIVLGTPHYMSPEQIRGRRDLDARSDQYSLGVVLYECVTGRRPFEDVTPYALLQRTVEGDFPPPRRWAPALPSGLEQLILRAMSRQPEARFETTRALGLALLEHASVRVRDEYIDELSAPSRTAVALAAPATGNTSHEPNETIGELDTAPVADLPAALGSVAPVSHVARPGRARARWWAASAAALAAAVALVGWRWRFTEGDWQARFAAASFAPLVDFPGSEHGAVISRDGKFVAFLSDRDGPVDVWLTQVGSGQFSNLTRGAFPELINPELRTLGFSADGALVTFWSNQPGEAAASDMSVWAAPLLGGPPRLWLPGVTELDWSSDGERLVYHTSAPGDPTYVRGRDEAGEGRLVLRASEGVHAHFPSWSAAGDFIYFVQGTPPDALDVWRVAPEGGAPERITQHSARVSHPVPWSDRTLLYLATSSDGSGPWLHGMDLDRRVPHRIGTQLDRYTSLAASADGRRLVATLASSKETLWGVPLGDVPADGSRALRVPLETGHASSPRLGPDYLLYVSTVGTSESIWKLAGGRTERLWGAGAAHILGAPAIAPGGGRIAFSVERQGRTELLVMRANGTETRVVSDALRLQGGPAWAPDGQSLVVAALHEDTPHLYRIGLDARPPLRLSDAYALDPVWDPEGRFVLYSGPDIGTRFALEAVAIAEGAPRLPELTLTRGSRRACFVPGRRALIVLRGEMHHKDLWQIDLDTGAERRLSELPADFDVRDFDVSPDGRELVLERVQDQSDIVLIELPSAG
jgi:serine/threonine protein kinase/Tol biopolymer transport system component